MNDPMIVDLAACADAATRLVGGKGAHLGVLAHLGLPVPEGFVITAPALAEAFADAPRDPSATTPLLPQDLAERLDDELERRGWSGTPLAVRSSAPQEDSATASFAGIYHSALNVIGSRAVEHAVATVWSSLWTPQAVAYRERIGLAEADAAMAVVIMPMVPVVAAGVAFTCEPQTGRDDRIVINAVQGLGEALVGGLESGEEVVIEEDRLTEELSVVARRPASQRQAVLPLAGGGTGVQVLAGPARQVLDDTQALQLGRLLRDAAQALDYADPCYDIEWAWTGDRFMLVQARPVTARAWKTYPGLAGQPAIWSNGNTRDVAPHVMGAMDWVGWRRAADQLLEEGYRLAGFPLHPGARRSALFNGRIYLNVSLIQWEGFDGFGVTPKAMNALLGGHHPEIAVPPTGWRDRLRRAGYAVRYLAKSGAHRRRGRREAEQAFALARSWRTEDLSAYSDLALVEQITEITLASRRRSGMLFLQGSSGGSLHTLLELVGRHLPGEAHALVAAVMAGGEPSVSARQGYDLMALAQSAARDAPTKAWLDRGAPWDLAELPVDNGFRRAFAEFIERYGHRGIYETYIHSRRFHEDPTYLLDAIAGLLDTDPAALAARRKAAADQAWGRLREALPLAKRLLARSLIRMAQQECNDRELARSAFIATSDVLRGMTLELAGRLCRRGFSERPEDVFHLTPHEAQAAVKDELTWPALRPRIARRRRQMAEWDANEAPEVIVAGQAVGDPQRLSPRQADGVWRGVAVGSGMAEGTARVIRSPEEGVRLKPGEIMVAPSTDPAWTPLFLKAGGLVMETGGYLSHGAIVAREFGIPAVVNLPGILAAVSDGKRLRVDGRSGEVAVEG